MDLLEGRLSTVHGHRKGVPAFPLAIYDAGLFLFPIGGPLLSLCGVALWIGQVPTVLHPINASLLSGATSVTQILRVGLSRRLSHSAIFVWRGGRSGSLCGSQTVHRTSTLLSRVETSSEEGRADGLYNCGTLERARRHGRNKILLHSAQGEESQSLARKC